MEILLQLFEIAPLDKKILQRAIEENGKDFEDSIIYSSAFEVGADVIVTRDPKGFKHSRVSVLSLEEFLGFWGVVSES